LLSYDEKVTTYWPEFGKHGKGHITVSDCCRHEAGLWRFCEQFPMEYTLTDNIKKNKIGDIIERTHFFKIPDGTTKYHAVTKDYLLNEIFRRVEPQGRTMGEYFDQEISKQFGIDIRIKQTEAQLNDNFTPNFWSVWNMVQNGKKKREEGGFCRNMKMGEAYEYIKKGK
jgi:CubicO group peptidase (beta-lactamase class C family)